MPDSRFANLIVKTSNRAFLCVAACLAIAGCRTGTFPDPNDPNDASNLQPEVLRSNIKSASDAFLERLVKREITNSQYKALIAEYAEDLLNKVKIDKVPSALAWEYADIFRLAKRWDESEKLLRAAVKSARNEDRRVNDSLRLAHVLCEEGKVDEGIKVARSVFDVEPRGKAPILPATLLEIEKAGKKTKGHEIQLAQLLRDAIIQGQKTEVDVNSEAGKLYIQALPFHVRNAWSEIIDLYDSAGRQDLAEQARKDALNDMSKTARA